MPWRPAFLAAARWYSGLRKLRADSWRKWPHGSEVAASRTPPPQWCASIARQSARSPATVTRCTRGHDPRALRLIEVADELGTAGRHVEIAQAIEKLLPQLIGQPLALNVSGAIPAVLLDAGYPLLALKGVPMLARTASLVAHLLEEQQRPIGFVMSHAAAQAIDYDGEMPPGFRPSDGG